MSAQNLSIFKALKPEDLTEASLKQTEEEIARARTQAKTPLDWAFIHDAEALLAYARRQTTTEARLRAAREAVAHLGKDWNPQRGSP